MTSIASPVTDELPSIRVLGGFSVLVARSPVPVPNNAQRVLGFLIVTGLEQRRDSIATHLWPGASPDRAMSNLRTALWRIRQLHPLIVQAGRSLVHLDERIEVDYEVLISQARRIISDPDPDDSLVGLPLDRLEAELLPGWDEEWLLLDRERHRQLRIHALERLSELLTVRGMYAQAIDVACAAIRVEPLHESAHAALISAHMAEGNRTEAIRQYRAYSRLLKQEVGLTPSAQLEQLLDDC